MINIANDVYTYVVNKVRATYPKINSGSKPSPSSASFPYLSVVQASNTITRRMRTAEKIEKAVSVMFQVETYSDKGSGNQAQAREILGIADDAMAELGFTRITYEEDVTNIQSSIYRCLARYEGVVIPREDGKFYIHTN